MSGYTIKNIPVTDKEITDHCKKFIIEYYETALKNGRCSVNYYFAPNSWAKKDLVKDGVIKEIRVGKVYVGSEYKGHLFKVSYGPGDCEENLINLGEI